MIRPIRFRGPASSANQVSRAWEFSQSGFEGLRVRPMIPFQCPIFVQSGFSGQGFEPIRLQGARVSANQISRSWGLGQSYHFSVLSSSNQVFRDRGLSQSGFKALEFQPIRFREAGVSTNQIISVSYLRPIRFRGAGSLANHMISVCLSRRTSFFELRVQPIRFF
jgi:hypothetical protein